MGVIAEQNFIYMLNNGTRILYWPKIRIIENVPVIGMVERKKNYVYIIKSSRSYNAGTWLNCKEGFYVGGGYK